MRLLVVPARRTALDALVLHATTLRIPVVEVEGGTLTALAGFDGHQGVALVVAPRQWATLDDVLARARERGEPPFVLVLDSLEDPQNLGSLLRSAEAAGVHGVIFPTRRPAPLSPSAVKASAGAVEHLLLVPVDDLPGALADLHVRGLRIVGADESRPDLPRGRPARAAGRRRRQRGPGHRPGRPPAARPVVRIPMHGRIASLNAAVAGSVLLFEAAGQRGPAPARRRRAAEPAGERSDASGAEPPTRRRGRRPKAARRAPTEAEAPASGRRHGRRRRAAARSQRPATRQLLPVDAGTGRAVGSPRPDIAALQRRRVL